MENITYRTMNSETDVILEDMLIETFRPMDDDTIEVHIRIMHVKIHKHH